MDAVRRPVPIAAVGLALLLAACSGSDGTGSTGATQAAPRTDPVDHRPEPGYAGPTLLGRLDDKSLSESSGLVASRRNPGLLWTHNDAGDAANLYCLTGEARRCGTWRVTGAQAQDWEAIATGPGPVAGEQYVYIGDIGDNDEERADVVVYRLVEPAAPAGGAGPASTAPADALRLRYEDGPHDAEALIVHPGTGDLFVVTKDKTGAGVYKAAVGATVLTRIADFGLGDAEVVTGGDISPDGRRVVVVTRAQGYELRLPEGGTDFDGIWRQPRRPVALAQREQGEAIAYRLDGEALLTTSEGTPLPLHEVRAKDGAG